MSSNLQLAVEQRQIRDQLETRLEELRKRRYEFTEPEYLNQLELILRPLSELYKETEQAHEKPSAVSEAN